MALRYLQSPSGLLKIPATGFQRNLAAVGDAARVWFEAGPAEGPNALAGNYMTSTDHGNFTDLATIRTDSPILEFDVEAISAQPLYAFGWIQYDTTTYGRSVFLTLKEETDTSKMLVISTPVPGEWNVDTDVGAGGALNFVTTKSTIQAMQRQSGTPLQYILLHTDPNFDPAADLSWQTEPDSLLVEETVAGSAALYESIAQVGGAGPIIMGTLSGSALEGTIEGQSATLQNTFSDGTNELTFNTDGTITNPFVNDINATWTVWGLDGVPRSYSALIAGTGSVDTLTANVNASVGQEVILTTAASDITGRVAADLVVTIIDAVGERGEVVVSQIDAASPAVVRFTLPPNKAGVILGSSTYELSLAGSGTAIASGPGTTEARAGGALFTPATAANLLLYPESQYQDEDGLTVYAEQIEVHGDGNYSVLLDLGGRRWETYVVETEQALGGEVLVDFAAVPAGDYTWGAEWSNFDAVQWESIGGGLRIKGDAVTPISRIIRIDQKINAEVIYSEVLINPHEQDHMSAALYQADGAGYYSKYAGNGRIDLFGVSAAGVQTGIALQTLQTDLPMPVRLRLSYSNATKVLTLDVGFARAIVKVDELYAPIYGGIFAVAEFNNTADLLAWAMSGTTSTVIRSLNGSVAPPAVQNGDFVNIEWTNDNNSGPYDLIDEKGNTVSHPATVIDAVTDRITLAIPGHWVGNVRVVDSVSSEERTLHYVPADGFEAQNLGNDVVDSINNPINAAAGSQLIYSDLSTDGNLVTINDRGEIDIVGEFTQTISVAEHDGTTLGALQDVVVYEGIESRFTAPSDVVALNGTALDIDLNDYYNDTINLDPAEQGSVGTLEIVSSNFPAGISRNGNDITGTLGTADGEYTPSVVVTDPSGTSQPLGLRIIVAPEGNVAPELANAIPNQGFQAGVTFSYVFPASTFIDRNGDALSYTYENLPSDIMYFPRTRAIEGKHGIDLILVTVVASDGEFSVPASYQITFTLGAPIRAKDIPDMTWNIGQPIAGIDLDEYIEGLPDTWQIQGAVFTGVSVVAGMLQGTPAEGLTPGDYEVSIRAENNAGAITSNTFMITLKEPYKYFRTQRHHQINGI